MYVTRNPFVKSAIKYPDVDNGNMFSIVQPNLGFTLNDLRPICESQNILPQNAYSVLDVRRRPIEHDVISHTRR